MKGFLFKSVHIRDLRWKTSSFKLNFDSSDENDEWLENILNVLSNYLEDVIETEN